MDNNLKQTVNIPINFIELNDGQIDGLPKNPRFIRDERFEKLVKSIKDAPEMLYLRELIVVEHNCKYVVIGGNMRLRASMELGFKELPCKILPADTPADKLREYTIKDNNGFGENDWDLLANEWDESELTDWGMELPKTIGNEKDLSEKLEYEFKIEVTLDTEEEQEKLYNELTNNGYICRILTL